MLKNFTWQLASLLFRGFIIKFQALTWENYAVSWHQTVGYDIVTSKLECVSIKNKFYETG
jgi:hypothetical protein